MAEVKRALRKAGRLGVVVPGVASRKRYGNLLISLRWFGE